MRVWSCSANLRSNTCVELKQLLLNCFPALVLQIVVWTGSNSRHNRFRNGRSTTFPESFLRLGASPDIHVHRTAVFFIFLRGHIYLLHSLLPATSGIAAVSELFSAARCIGHDRLGGLTVQPIFQYSTPALGPHSITDVADVV